MALRLNLPDFEVDSIWLSLEPRREIVSIFCISARAIDGVGGYVAQFEMKCRGNVSA